ncbi:MAG: hypothetical protein AABY15_01790 [Nanoarchaeota archaeon]
MGWWSENVYGGDAPLKWQEEIYALCKTEVYGEDNKVQPIPVKVIKKSFKKITKLVEENSTDANHKNLGYQVLGAILMHAGFDMDEVEVRERIIESIEGDDYSKENYIRKNVMKNFKKLIKEYAPENPVNIISVNVFEESEDAEEEIAKEFKQIFGLMKARIKKLEAGIEEKSGVKDYDEGYEAASREEVDFLNDFMELMSKMEMMGVLFEKIEQGLVGNSTPSPTPMGEAKSSSRKSASGSGKDIMPG